MNFSVSLQPLAETGGRLVSDSDFQIASYLFRVVINPVSLTAGFIGNILNIFVFVKIGVRDSMTASFLALSVTDLAYTSVSIVTTALNEVGFSRLHWPFPVIPFMLSGAISWYKFLFYDVTVYITTYISVARCCCVTMPLKFKDTFTVRRTVVILAIIAVGNTALRVPVLVSYGLAWRTSPFSNSSMIFIWYADHWSSVQALHDLGSQTILSNACLFIVLICMVILIFKLVQASRFRRSMQITPGHGRECVENSPSVPPPSPVPAHRNGMKSRDNNIRSTTPTILNARELQIVKAVVLVAGLLLVSVLYSSVQALARRLVPQFDNDGRYRWLFAISNDVRSSLSYVNAGANPFIYLRFNAKYRAVVTGWIRRGSPKVSRK
ncbi:uncharacterized protein LOC101854082 [Aplysia californica]|uniref:Uncharacterized protein LOC101854082 n=1 Tax=Aplysia californica TaxID=6500 RepID=A0ABM0JPB9_APLCA|nr:uncharacterized protein LOC101854082 [Aplysia californica]